MTSASKPAALVLGGGIAGMQAALDIAEAGYPVYLVERLPGIGGRMAQLDKTFPTLDCASCIITPMLADVARNPNILLRTYAEIESLQGGPRAFRVTVRHKPRYVDVSKCVGCALCAQVCPVPVPDLFNENLSSQQAIHRLFAQVVPNAFSIHRSGRAPCRTACPAGQRIPGFIALIREGRYPEALRTLRLDNPFPGICGRICPHPCEQACNRGALDQPVNIRALKRFAADQAKNGAPIPVEPVPRRFEQRIAIIGAGPAGLTAAQDLVLAGYPVTVFEALPVAGGMLRVGVPEFRLPTEIVEQEVQAILDLGVELRLNNRVDDIEGLREQGYAAVLLAVGAQRGVRLPLPGHDLPGVLLNTDFLRQVRLGHFQHQDLGRALVLGGGDVAVDCARTALRFGATSVSLACLEEEATMPAHRWELEAARAEGVHIYPGRTVRQILGEDRVTGVDCERVASFSFDESGQLHVETIAGSGHVLDADTVIFAVGQRVAAELCPGAEQTAARTLAVDPATCMTSQPAVFAAGDATTGTSLAVEAIAAGHRAALGIHRYLHPEAADSTVIDPWRTLRQIDLPVIRLGREALSHHPRLRRTDPSRSYFNGGTAHSFAETEASLTEEQARSEAARCLNCGTCAECLECLAVCEASAIDHNQRAWDEELDVAAIVVATGFDLYDPRRKPELGYGKYPNVMHALEVERMLSASGPTAGAVRLQNGKTPQNVVFIQCVGSRDRQPGGNPYCSRVCCMYTAKQAHLLRDRLPDANITVFYIDIRAFGKGFEEFHERVRGERVRYRRGNVSEVVRGQDGRLLVRTEDTLLGAPVQLEADLVVLATALIPRRDTFQTAAKLAVQTGGDGFYLEADPKLDPTSSQVPGIFLAGACQGPKDILDSVAHARAAAASALVLLSKQDKPDARTDP